MENACRQASLWRGSGLPVLRVAVNLSARQLVQGDLPGSVERIVGETGIDPRGLELEITESHLIEDLQASCRVFEEIKGALDGIRVSVDDFGTGYASMTYLKNLPVDTLKIGPPFVSGVPDDPEDITIATNMIGLARSLRLDAIVEGVETWEQLAFVRDQRCALAQGYYFSPCAGRRFRQVDARETPRSPPPRRVRPGGDVGRCQGSARPAGPPP